MTGGPNELSLGGNGTKEMEQYGMCQKSQMKEHRLWEMQWTHKKTNCLRPWIHTEHWTSLMRGGTVIKDRVKSITQNCRGTKIPGITSCRHSSEERCTLRGHSVPTCCWHVCDVWWRAEQVSPQTRPPQWKEVCWAVWGIWSFVMVVVLITRQGASLREAGSLLIEIRWAQMQKNGKAQ